MFSIKTIIRGMLMVWGITRSMSYVKTYLPVKPVVHGVFDTRLSSLSRTFRVQHVSTRRLHEQEKSKFIMVFKCTQGIVTSNFTSSTDSTVCLFPRPNVWDMENDSIMENLEIVNTNRLVAVCWHKPSENRVFMRLDLIPMGKHHMWWRSTILATLHEGPCCRLHVGDNLGSQDATLIFHNGKIWRWKNLDSLASAYRYDTRSFTQYTTISRNMLVIGGGSGILQLWEFLENDKLVMRSQIDHRPYGTDLIRSATVVKISNGFKDQSAVYHVITLDDHFRLFVWEIRMFCSDEPIHVKIIRAGRDILIDRLRSLRSHMDFNNMHYQLEGTRQSLSLRLPQNRIRVYPMDVLDDESASLMATPHLECMSSNNRPFYDDSSVMFHQNGQFLLCVHGSNVEIFDTELVRYYLENPVPRTVRKWNPPKITGCIWTRVDPPSDEFVHKQSDLIERYIELTQWMSKGSNDMGGAPSSEN